MLRIFNRAAQYFISDRRNIPLPEEQELKDVADQVAFGPLKIGVRDLACGFFQMYQLRLC